MLMQNTYSKQYREPQVSATRRQAHLSLAIG